MDRLRTSKPNRIMLVLTVLIPYSLHAFPQVVRQPYLQVITPNSVIIRWNTSDSITGMVRYGPAPETLNDSVSESVKVTLHQVPVTGLSAATKYYYAVDTLEGYREQYFITSPVPGTRMKTRFWVIADFGQTDASDNVARHATVNRWKEFNGGSCHADLLLSLGDQTENDTRQELQLFFFNPLDSVLLNTPLYTIQGNHDATDELVNYRATFTLPDQGEAGGYPSDSQDYFSFDYANIHVVALSTEIDDINGPQLTWLKMDLQNIDHSKTDWLIALLHRPFHSGGYHPTDESSTAQKQRTYWLTQLEDYGVDVVLQAHNAIYERSFLLDDLIGKTTDLIPENIINGGNGRIDGDGAYYKGRALSPHHGTVFIEVAPGGDAVSNNANYQIFSSTFSGTSIEGSVVLDVDGEDRMDVYFLCNEPDENTNYVRDYFTIIKTDSINTGIPKPGKDRDGFPVGIYPNPFRQSTTISYSLQRPGHVCIDVYDAMGRHVSRPEEGFREAGLHTAEWSATDCNGRNLPGGLYIARIRTGRKIGQARLLLLD